jgi:hypothetical protein
LWTVPIDTMLRCHAAIYALAHIPAWLCVFRGEGSRTIGSGSGHSARGHRLRAGRPVGIPGSGGQVSLCALVHRLARMAHSSCRQSPDCARCGDPPPFADTEASWRHL